MNGKYVHYNPHDPQYGNSLYVHKDYNHPHRARFHIEGYPYKESKEEIAKKQSNYGAEYVGYVMKLWDTDLYLAIEKDTNLMVLLPGIDNAIEIEFPPDR